MAFEKGDKKVISGWCWFDWANSVYPLVITTAVFPLYYDAIIGTPEQGCVEAVEECQKFVTFMGMKFISTELYAYAVSFSFLLVAMMSPILSGIADYAGRKKMFMKIFSTFGAASSAGLFFFTGPENLWLGLLFSVFASIGFAGSLVFYNAFLPEIAHEKDLDKISARGFTMGYIGSSIMLILCLVMIMKWEMFGFPNEGFPTRLSFLLAGLWWYGFAMITFARLPETPRVGKLDRKTMFTKGIHEVVGVFRQLNQKHNRKLRLFLLAFFFYSMGYMTVIYLATLFGSKVLHLETTPLILTVLIIQFVAIAGSYFFAYLSKRIGNVEALMVAVVIWSLVCGGTWFVTDVYGFYLMAFFVGTVMGGIQALSRSTYAKLLPETKDTASFYSFYDITEKVAITVGSYSFGLIEVLTGSMRGSALFLAVFFSVGLVLLYGVSRMPDINRLPEFAEPKAEE